MATTRPNRPSNPGASEEIVMIRKLGTFWSASGLLASILVALGISSADAVGDFEDWANVSAGYAHTCGVRKNGKLYCWGDDNKGQIGDEDEPIPASVPRRIGTFEDWASVSAGDAHTCGVRKNGKLYCWGDDYSGQIGDGDTNASPVTAPLRIGTFEDWGTVSAGHGHTCGARTNGKLYCWGDDSRGQIGDNDDVGATAPRRIGTFEDWANVSAGGYHSCGVRKNGKLYCWGWDANGQVGNGDQPTHRTLTPQRVGTFEDWASTSAGWIHSCGVRKNGKLYCWGNDGEDQVGNGSPAGDVIAPQRLGSYEDWTSASAGGFHSCAIRALKLYCWGLDASGQVGDRNNPDPATAPRRI
jgi:alpha-tubulin suppressor-like RCC1 family protein